MLAAYQTYQLAQSGEADARRREEVLEQRAATDQRLAQQRITDRMTWVRREIEFKEQRLAAALERMQGRLAGLRLKMWREGEVR